jgi:outer membrane immunogenic protein
MKFGAVVGGALAALMSLSVALPVSTARAADMTVAPRPGVSGYIPAVFQWTGYYIGVGLGGGFGTSTFIDPFTGQTGTPSLSGVLVGGITGINYQIGAFVLGGEFDFTGSWSKGSVNDAAGNNLLTSVFWTSSVTGRFGYAFDRLLIFAKGGWAFDYDRDTATLPANTNVLGTIYHTNGWTVGGGAEYAFTDHWTVRLEYDYFKFPTKATTFSGPASPSIGGQVGLSLGQILGYVSYKF